MFTIVLDHSQVGCLGHNNIMVAKWYFKKKLPDSGQSTGNIIGQIVSQESLLVEIFLKFVTAFLQMCQSSAKQVSSEHLSLRVAHSNQVSGGQTHSVWRAIFPGCIKERITSKTPSGIAPIDRVPSRNDGL